MTNRKFDLSAQVRDWDYVVLEQNDSCCLTNISRLKIVGDDVFDKRSLVMLLFIISLRAVERHGGDAI